MQSETKLYQRNSALWFCLLQYGKVLYCCYSGSTLVTVHCTATTGSKCAELHLAEEHWTVPHPYCNEQQCIALHWIALHCTPTATSDIAQNCEMEVDFLRRKKTDWRQNAERKKGREDRRRKGWKQQIKQHKLIMAGRKRHSGCRRKVGSRLLHTGVRKLKSSGLTCMS